MILIADSGSTKTDWCIVFNGTLIKRIVSVQAWQPGLLINSRR